MAVEEPTLNTPMTIQILLFLMSEGRATPSQIQQRFKLKDEHLALHLRFLLNHGCLARRKISAPSNRGGGFYWGYTPTKEGISEILKLRNAIEKAIGVRNAGIQKQDPMFIPL